MVQARHDPPFTYRELLALPADDLRHELVDGAHRVTASPTPRHQRVVFRLATLLAEHLEEHPAGELLLGPVDVVLSETDVLAPDLLYVRPERDAIVTEGHLRGAPDLVVEVLSPSTRDRDRGPKHRIYERHGVGEYWIVDPDTETIDVFRARAGQLDLAATISNTPDETLTTPLLPALEIALAALFSE